MTPPKPGTVIRYAYLWASEEKRGRSEGNKDRPSLVVAVSVSDSEILVLAVTHSKPFQESDGVELPLEVKRSLGLDRQQSWIVTNEANFFRWPGPDVRPVRKGTLTYGQIPHALLQEVAASLVENRKQQRLKVIRRTS